MHNKDHKKEAFKINEQEKHKIISYYEKLDIEVTDEEVNSEFRNLKTLLSKEQSNKRNKIIRLSFSIVAAAVLVVGVFLFHGTTKNYTLMDYVNSLYESNLPLNSTVDNRFVSVSVPSGCTDKVVLPDGSFMNINAGTTVIYPKDFNSLKEREIYVDGEIFIDVTHKDKQPFIVRTLDFDVTVLGTAFNISSFSSENDSQVVLLRGKVSVKNKNNKEAILLPNEAIRLNSTYLYSKRKVNTSDYVSWTEKKLSFNNKSVKEILNELSHFYGVEITFDSSISKYSLNGTIDLDVSIDKALSSISKIIPIKVIKSSNNYHLVCVKVK